MNECIEWISATCKNADMAYSPINMVIYFKSSEKVYLLHIYMYFKWNVVEEISSKQCFVTTTRWIVTNMNKLNANLLF